MTIHPRLIEKLESHTVSRSPSIPVILYYCRPRNEVRQCILHRYGPIKYELPFINAMALDLPPEKVKLIGKERMVQWVTEDVTVSKAVISKTHGVGESEAASSKTPSRPSQSPVSVAIIDTGVALHPALTQPVNRIRAFTDFVNHKAEPYDDDGHGTHIAGIVSGLASWPDQKEQGKGEGSVNIVAIKALDEDGNGSASDILAAMQWTLNNSRFYNIRVVNLSLGVTAEEDYDNDPLVRGVDVLTRYGLTVVTAAGNSGPNPKTISSPGICRNAITVGASDGEKVATFSSRGPTPQGLLKPDLLAPGVDILSLKGEDSGYLSQSGTSMAAPFVSREAALLYETFPFASPWLIKHLLLQQTKPLPKEPPEAQGRGVLQIR